MKRHRVDSKTASERMLWSHENGFCWACGATERLHTHEIVRRSETAKALNPANYARLCERCHAEAHGGYITKGVLVFLKGIYDRENLDIDWLRSHAIRKGIEVEFPERGSQIYETAMRYGNFDRP